jgi:hypothetical protein
MVYQCGLRLAARLKSGGPSLGRSPGAHKQRQPVNQDQIQIFGEIGSTQFLEQGFAPCSFFISHILQQAFELAAERRENPAQLVACSPLGSSIDGCGVIQISASLYRAFLAANLQLERIRASESRRGRVCEISTRPERDRAMLRRSK